MMLAAPAVALINHLLRGAPWAMERLAPFAGKTARIKIAPATLDLVVLNGGEVAQPMADIPPVVEITLTPGLLPRLLLKDEAAYRDVQVSGETAFASEIAYVMKNISWDAEEDLSHLFGDIAAHRMTKTAVGFLGWRSRVALSLAQNLVEYWTEEQPILAKAHHVQHLVLDVDALRDDVERLEKRLERLEHFRDPKLSS